MKFRFFGSLSINVRLFGRNQSFALHFVYTLYARYMPDNRLQFVEGVDRERDAQRHYEIFGLGVERLHGEIEMVGDRIDHVDKKMESVDGADLYRHGEESAVGLIFH